MITASDIAKLRAQTGAGMMDCKNSLEEAGGDNEKAAELLRKKGILKTAKRADKVAADGKVVAVVNSDQKSGAIAEVNSETDFVAKSDDFIKFAKDVADAVLTDNPADLQALEKSKLPSGKTVAETVGELTLKIGEKIGVRRFARYSTDGVVAMYLHGSKIGVLVELTGNDHGLALEIAMHVAASNPKCLSRDQVDQDLVAKEKAIYAEQLKGKPANIMENILKGKLEKFYGEICLLEQPFIKDEEKTVKQMLENGKCEIKRYVRFELGEGLTVEKKDFAAEVAEQLK
ncbi:MAG: translation elongation factor Ts [Patescibacteria group bacterium]